MKLDIGMYVRTKDGYISQYKYYDTMNMGKLLCIPLSNRTFANMEDIVKTSYNIIDLIEVGDYVNGYKVSLKGYDYAHFVQCDYPVENGTTNHYKFYKQAIESVLTKEMYKDMEYRIGEQV